MTLIDAGPLFALIDVRQADNHKRCAAILPALAPPLVTTWPCFTEAMYLAYSSGGKPMQDLLWQYYERGVIHFHDLSAAEIARMRLLMDQYADAPMDLADGSVVAIAETLGLRRVFTLDRHFHAYRCNGNEVFEVIP